MAGYRTHLVNVWTTEGLGSVPLYTMVDSLLWTPEPTAPQVPRPGVVFVHGWGRYPYDTLARALAPRLAEAGVVVLALGMRRRGGEGQVAAVPDDDLRDIKVGLDALAQHGVQSAVLVGQDVGALSVARYAAQAGDNRVAGIALVDRIDDLHAFLVDAVGAEQVQEWTELARQTTYESKSDLVRIDADIPRPGRTPLWIFQPAAPFLAWWSSQPRLRLPRVLEEVGVPVVTVTHDETGTLRDWLLATLPRPGRPARFELVETSTDGDVPLVGYLAEPSAGARADAAVLVVHGLTTGPFSPMVKMFLPHYVDHGFTAVAMETRRSGARCIADSFPENDTADVDAFVELLLARGFSKIVLVGASLGSQAISRYVARRHHPAVVGCVHLAPTGDMPSDTVRNVDPRELARVVGEATEAVASGHGDRLVRYDLTEQGPSRYHATRRTFWRAESWLAWWGPDAPTSHLELISDVDVPVLLLSGTADDYNDQARLDALTAAAERAPLVDQVWVPADHGLRGAEEAATAEAVAWLERHGLVEPAPARPAAALAPAARHLVSAPVPARPPSGRTTTDPVDTVIDGPAGKLAVRSRGLHAGAPSAVVCVQGALLPGQTAFDIPVGPPDLSLLRVLADAGHAAVTFAVRGYGESEVPADPLAISTEDGMADLAAVIDRVRTETGLERVHLFSWSWGGRVTGRFTEEHPELVDRLVLMDPALGGNTPTPELTPTVPFRPNTVEEFRRRIEAVHTDADVREAIAQYVAEHDPTSPNGIGVEGCGGPVPVAPERVTRPTLMIYGVDAAKAAYMQGPITREEFFARLATDDKVFAIVPDGGDYLHLQRGRHRLHRHVLEFLR